jgi:serine/threonine-protein kinase RsbW
MSDINVTAELNTSRNISKNIEPLLSEIQTSVELNEEQYYNLMLCIVEAVNNAAEHGNEFDENKLVFLNISAQKNSIIVTVKDQGEGFIPDVQKAFDMINSEENLYATRGRGVFLIHSLMSDVSYEIDNGTKVTMCLKLN